MTFFLILLLLFLFLLEGEVVLSQCHNNCNLHGRCNIYSQCDCFSGWTGADCAMRTCPSGPALADVPTGLDQAHASLPCSGQGVCNTTSGICICNSDFSGLNCGTRKGCTNDCSGHGRCLTLRQLALENTGYDVNYTTTYTLWDADLWKRCVCDPGYEGPDCSQRRCDAGIDPRLSSQTHERVTLVCDCMTSAHCRGQFKLRYHGVIMKQWLDVTTASTTSLANLIMSLSPLVYGPSSVYRTSSVVVYNVVNNNSLCVDGQVVKNYILFVRNAGDLPKISFYAKRLTQGVVYFETQQTIVCDCTSSSTCNGTIRLSFDGAVSSTINASSSSSLSIYQALQVIPTIPNAGYHINVTSTSTSHNQLCVPRSNNSMVITLRGDSGNAPRFGLVSTVGKGYWSHNVYDSTNTTAEVVYLVSNDGRDDHVKLCNGLGKCDFSTGVCSCALNWGPDANMGPCAQYKYNTSRDGGLGRCPGQYPLNYLSSTSASAPTYDNTANFAYRVYLSVNPAKPIQTPTALSAIHYYPYRPGELFGPRIYRDKGILVLNLTSNASAGPLLIDNKEDLLYFIDENPNPRSRFLGYYPINSDDNNGSYHIYLNLSTFGKVYSMAMDPTWWNRKLYFSVPSAREIYWVAMKGGNGGTTGSLTLNDVSRLSDYTGQHFLVSPSGLAVHFNWHRLFWFDRNTTLPANITTVVRSVDTTTYTLREEILIWANRTTSPPPPPTASSGSSSSYNYYDAVGNFTTLGNITQSDILIDFIDNNTLYFIDNTDPVYGIYSINLDATSPLGGGAGGGGGGGAGGGGGGVKLKTSQGGILYDKDNSIMTAIQYQEYTSPRRIYLSTQQGTATGKPGYLLRDQANSLLYWTDTFYNTIGYARTRTIQNDFFATGIAWQGNFTDQVDLKPIAMILDTGMGRIGFGSYVDCYGRGTCEKEKNFHCKCYANYFGDCRSRYCPKGRAWITEPRANNSDAHFRYLTCSGVGLCNYNTGLCDCPLGFEGPACERSSCPITKQVNASTCYNQGRCLSLRQAATYSSSNLNQNQNGSGYENGNENGNENENRNRVYGSKVLDEVTWDADRLSTCVIDQYGYYYDEHNLIYASPSIELAAIASSSGQGSGSGTSSGSRQYLNEQYISQVISGNQLNQTACRRGFNRRLLDKVFPKANTTSTTTVGYTLTAIGDRTIIQQSGSSSSTPLTSPDDYYSLYDQTQNILEIQSLTCNAQYGSFDLYWYNMYIGTLTSDMTLIQVQTILSSNPILGPVYLQSNYPKLCTTYHGGTIVNITFLTIFNFPIIPLLTIENIQLIGRPATITIDRIQAYYYNITEECSGHGYCNYNNGRCHCWDGYGSSDGLGNIGNHDDCGHYIYT